MSDQKPIREVLESRILAQINGELTPEESAELDAVIASNPELLQYRDQMRVLIKGIDEAADFFKAPDNESSQPPTRLSKDRRMAVLAKIAEKRPPLTAKQRRLRFHAPVNKAEWNPRRILAYAAGIILVLGVLSALLIPVVGGARKSSIQLIEPTLSAPMLKEAEERPAVKPVLSPRPQPAPPPMVTSAPTRPNERQKKNESSELEYLLRADDSYSSNMWGLAPSSAPRDEAMMYADKRISNAQTSSSSQAGFSNLDVTIPIAEQDIVVGTGGNGNGFEGVISGGVKDTQPGRQASLHARSRKEPQATKNDGGWEADDMRASTGEVKRIGGEWNANLTASIDALEESKIAADQFAPSSRLSLKKEASNRELDSNSYFKSKELTDATGEKIEKLRSQVYDVDNAKQTEVAQKPLPEKLTTQEPFSTFSLNVSDVSFRLAQAALQRHTLPTPSEIRAEEFINALPPEMPSAITKQDVQFDWELTDYPFGHDRQLLRFAVQAASTGRLPNQPANIVIVVDCSGSMQRLDRQQILEESLSALAEKLSPQDRLSAVVFAQTSRVIADGVNGAAASDVVSRVLTQRPEGGTNLELALKEAYTLAKRNLQANGLNRVVLLTDGAANLGEVNAKSLKELVTSNRKAGIALDAFGIGWDGYNDELMESLTRNSNGRYAFLNSPESAGAEFADKLAGALNLSAADVKVQIEWNPNRVISYRQIGYEKHQLKTEDFRNNAVDAAELSAAEAGQALYVVQLQPEAIGGLGTLRVRYLDPKTNDYKELSWPLEYPGNIAPLADASESHRLASAGALFADKLAQTTDAENYTLAEVEALIANIPSLGNQDDPAQQLRQMIRQARQILSE